MPITFQTLSGTREHTSFAHQTPCQTVVHWHAETGRFVVIELQPLLYGLDISSYTKQIALQLQSHIPSFEQLQVWLSQINPKTLKGNVLVGQLFETGKNYRVVLQSSQQQLVLLWQNHKLFRLPVTCEGMTGEIGPGDQILLGNQHVVEWLGSSVQELTTGQGLGPEKLMQSFTQQYKVLMVTIPQKRLSIRLDWLRSVTATAWLKKRDGYGAEVTPSISIRKNARLSSRRTFALLLATVFLSTLLVSVGFGIRKRQEFERSQKEQQLVENVKYRLEQAKSLQELNPLRAKVLLSEAKQALGGYREENRLPSDTIQNLEKEVASAYELVSGLVMIKEAPLFYDPQLLKDGFKPTQVSLAEQELVMLDSQQRTMSTLNLDSKAGVLVAGRDQVQNTPILASIPAWIFLYSQDRLVIVDKATQKQLKSFLLTKTTVSAMVGYGNNLYVLDVPNGQVLRFRGTKDGLSKSEEFFDEKQDVSGAVNLAVDGSVWILYGNGAVEKYTSGLRDALFPDFKLDKPIQQADQLFTDENSKNLYILDKSQGRVVSVTKRGEFTAEYTWEGLKTCDEIVVSEKIGKLLVVRDGKIWGIDIK